MPATNFRAIVNATGDKLHASDKNAMFAALREFASQDVVVTVERFREKRSNGQNAYYWAVVVPFVRRFWSKEWDIDLTEKQTHETLKKVFIGVIDTPMGPITRSSATLNVEQFVDYVESICSYFASEKGEYIPQPGE